MAPTIETRIRDCLVRFVRACGESPPELNDDTDLIKDLGMASDQGVEFVLDLCEAFEFNFPKDFNPFVHPTGHRGRKFGELRVAVEKLTCQEDSN